MHSDQGKCMHLDTISFKTIQAAVPMTTLFIDVDTS